MMTSLLSLMMMMTLLSAMTTCDATPPLIDLSHNIDFDTIPNFPFSPLYNQMRVARVLLSDDTASLDVNLYSTIEHSSTHIDAPNHVKLLADVDAPSIEQVPLENTVAYGVMIDCVREAEADASYSVTLQKIFDWERANGRIPLGAAVLFNFGYFRFFVDNQQRYRGTDNIEDPTSYVYPNVTVEVVQFLLERRNMLILGSDTISPEIPSINGELTEFPVHRMMFEREKIIVENLNNLSALPPRGFLFSVAPAKFVGATGVQVRAYAAILDEGQGSRPRPLYRPQRVERRPSYYNPRGYRCRI